MSLFACKLKELRLKTGSKQIDIAKYLGILPRTVRFYESGEHEPDIDMLIKIADFYNVSIDYLVGRTNNLNSHKNQ